MYLVAVAWIYVVTMMAIVEGTSTTGTVLGAIITFLFYGVLPLALVLYLLATPARRAAQRAARLAALPGAPLIAAPHRGDHPPGQPIPAEREEA
jgi:hypothetical protein